MWWTSSLEATVATVVTQYLQYNNTVIPNTTTIYNDRKKVESILTPPRNVITNGNLQYTLTFLDWETTIKSDPKLRLPPDGGLFEPTAIRADYFWENSIMTAPTPFVLVNSIGYAPGAMASGGSSCTMVKIPQESNPNFPLREAGLSTGYDLDPPYVFVPSPTTIWRDRGFATPPAGILDAWISQMPNITDQYPWLRECTPLPGSGEPSVHVPVTALTAHATTTIFMPGMGGVGANPEAPKTTPPATSSTPLEPQAPSSEAREDSSKDTDPPLQTSAPQAPNTNPTNAQSTPPENAPSPVVTPSQFLGVLPNPSFPIPLTPIVVTTVHSRASGSQASGPQASGPQASGPDEPPDQPVSLPGLILPDGSTLLPGSTVIISDIQITVPTDVPTVVILPNGDALSQGATTTISGTVISVPTGTPGLVVVDGNTVAAPNAFVVVGGTTFPIGAAPTPPPVDGGTFGDGKGADRTPVESITVGSSVLAVTVVTGSPTPGADNNKGVGVVLPNGKTLTPGQTTVIGDKTLVISGSEGRVWDASTTGIVELFATRTSTPIESITVGSSILAVTVVTKSPASGDRDNVGVGIVLSNGETLTSGQTTVVGGKTVEIIGTEVKVWDTTTTGTVEVFAARTSGGMTSGSETALHTGTAVMETGTGSGTEPTTGAASGTETRTGSEKPTPKDEESTGAAERRNPCWEMLNCIIVLSVAVILIH
jgi:hypothetical protein